MDLLAHMRIFARVGQSETLETAAHALDLTPQTVRRSLARLEKHLNCSLLTRGDSTLTLTEIGREFHGQCARIVSGVDEAVRGVIDTNLQPQGNLRVHAEYAFGKQYLIPLIAEYRQQHPDVTFDLTLDHQLPDLARTEVDVLVGSEPLQDGAFVTRNVGAIYSVLCASADYLAQKGTPVVPEDLLGHECLVALEEPANPDDLWGFEGPYGPVNVYLPPAAFQLNTRSAMVDAVRSGLGIGCIPAFLVSQDLSDDSLVRVLPSYHMESKGIHIACRAADEANVQVRSWVSFLLKKLPRLACAPVQPAASAG